MTRVSIVIRCFNEERHIGRLLTGIREQRLAPHEVIVVDSGSTDHTLEIAARFPVRIVPIAPEEFSFGRSLNRGCRAATGDVIVAASAHVYPVFDSWLEEITRPFADPEIALVYGRQQGHARTKYSEHQIFASWFPAKSAPRQDHPFCNNANAAIRRDLWKRFPYNEDLTGLEDLEWAKRVIDAGYHISYVAEAPVVHVHEERWRQVMNRYRREAIAHKQIYHDHRMGLASAVGLAALNVASDYLHALRDGVLLRNLVSIPMFRGAQFFGTYRGFAQEGPVSGRLQRRFYYPRGLDGRRRAVAPQTGRAIEYKEGEVAGDEPDAAYH